LRPASRPENARNARRCGALFDSAAFLAEATRQDGLTTVLLLRRM
jgi:hypothetical protein